MSPDFRGGYSKVGVLRQRENGEWTGLSGLEMSGPQQVIHGPWQPISMLLIMVAGLYRAGVRAKGPILGSV